MRWPWASRKRWEAWDAIRQRELLAAYRSLHEAQRLLEARRPITARFSLSAVEDHLRQAIVPSVESMRAQMRRKVKT